MKEKEKKTLGRKALLTAVIMLGLGVSAASAQASFHLGLGGGPQLTTFNSDIGSYSSLVNYNGGLLMELRLGKFFAVEADALYSVNGAKRNYKDSVDYMGDYGGEFVRTTYNTEDRMSYGQYHLLLKLNIPIGSTPILPYDYEGGPVSGLTVYGGPYYSNLLGFSRKGTISKEYVDSGVTTMNVPTEAQVKENGILSSDLGFTAGIGGFFGLSDRLTLNIDFRFSKGLMSFDGPENATKYKAGHFYIMDDDGNLGTMTAQRYPNPDEDSKFQNEGYYGHDVVTKVISTDPLDTKPPFRKSYYTYQSAHITHQAMGIQIGLKYKLFGK